MRMLMLATLCPVREFEPCKSLIFQSVSKFVNTWMFFLIWMTFEENLSIGFVLIYLTLTLFNMGGMMAPQNVFDQTLRRNKLKFGDF